MINSSLVLNNLKLINYSIKRVLPVFKLNHSWEDMYQEGFLALCKASEQFNPKRGYAFSTYAIRCIFNRIYRYISKCESSFLSFGYQTAHRITALRKLLQQYPERNLYDKEFICNKLKISPAEYNSLIKLAFAKSLSISEYPLVVDAYKSVIEDYDDAEIYFNKRLLNKLLKILSPIQYKTLIMKYGINGNKTYTAKEISKELNVSIDTVYDQLYSAKKKIKEYATRKHIDLLV